MIALHFTLLALVSLIYLVQDTIYINIYFFWPPIEDEEYKNNRTQNPTGLQKTDLPMDSRGEDQWNGRQMPAYHGRLGIKYGRVGSADGQKINYSDCHALPRCFSSRPRFCQNFSILSTPTFNVSNKQSNPPQLGSFSHGKIDSIKKKIRDFCFIKI